MFNLIRVESTNVDLGIITWKFSFYMCKIISKKIVNNSTILANNMW